MEIFGPGLLFRQYNGSNIFTDGQFACSYGEAPPLLEQIGRFLEDLETGEYERGCIALECLNSVPGALLLMALLEKRNQLCPDASIGLRTETHTPFFAAIALLLSRPTPPPAVPSCPCSIFGAEPNPLFNGRLTPPSRIYLRTSGSMGVSKLVVTQP